MKGIKKRPYKNVNYTVQKLGLNNSCTHRKKVNEIFLKILLQHMHIFCNFASIKSITDPIGKHFS